MTNIIELRKAIKTFLLTKCPRVYYELADADADYPYIVFSLPSSIGTQREDFILQIDFWDNAQDTTALETLVEAVDGDGDIQNPTGLNYKNIYESGKVAATFYRENRYSIVDEYKTLHRRQIRYLVTSW